VVGILLSTCLSVKTLGNNVFRTHGDDAESDRVCDSVSNVDENNETVDEQDDVEDDKTDEDEEEGDNKDGDGYDDYQGDDGSMGESTLDPTIDGNESTGEDYDYNKWNDIIVKEYGIWNVEENVILTQLTIQHPGKFSRLLAECTYTSQRVPGEDNISHSGDHTPVVTPRSMCQHGLYHCTYTIDWEVFLKTEKSYNKQCLILQSNNLFATSNLGHVLQDWRWFALMILVHDI